MAKEQGWYRADAADIKRAKAYAEGRGTTLSNLLAYLIAVIGDKPHDHKIFITSKKEAAKKTAP